MLTLDRVPPGGIGIVKTVGGERSFRRRLMELGLLSGTKVEVVRVAPLGDPMELRVRGCSISIRRAEARGITITEPEVSV